MADFDGGGGGIWQWVKLKLDQLSAQKVKADTKAALEDATDPKVPSRNLGLIGRAFDGVRVRAIALGTFLGGLFLRALDQAANALRYVVRQSIEAQDAQAQLEARLKSTGGVAGRTAEQLNEQAAALQKVTKFSDEAVTDAQTMLLQFTRVRGGVFDRATESVLDLATAMRTDAPSAAKTLGAALDNPIDGLRRLSQAGVIFTKGEKDLVEQFIRTNRLAEAQDVILDKLEERMGGAAKAARDTLGGALEGLRNEFDNAFEVSAEGSQGLIAAINGITKAIPVVRGWLDTIAKGWAAIGIHAAVALEQIKFGIRALDPRRLWSQDARDALEEQRVTLERMKEAALDMMVELEHGKPAAASIDAVTASTEGLLEATEDTEDAATKAKRAEQERFDALVEGYELGILKGEEYLELLAKIKQAEDAVTIGGGSLDERTEQERRRLVGKDIDLSQLNLGEIGTPFVNLPPMEQIQTRLTKDFEIPTEGFSEFFINNFEEIENASQLAAIGMQSAWENAFGALIMEGRGLGGAFQELFSGIAAAGLDAIAQLAAGKVKENMARALESVGLALLGDPSKLGAAAKFTAAAAAWAAAGGFASSAASAISGSAGADRPTADVTGRAVDRLTQPRNVTIVIVDGFDPRNPAHIEKLAAGEAERIRQWGDSEPYYRGNNRGQFVFEGD